MKLPPLAQQLGLVLQRSFATMAPNFGTAMLGHSAGASWKYTNVALIGSLYAFAPPSPIALLIWGWW